MNGDLVNTDDGEVIEYHIWPGFVAGESEDETDFPRGTLLAYRAYIVTGLKSPDEAAEWKACPKCKDAIKGNAGDPCWRCGTLIKGQKA